jgi:Glycerophosphoryl diester phosphodiesterase family
MDFEIQGHRGNDELTLRRLLAALPSSVELDVGLAGGEIVVAHDVDLADASGLQLERALHLAVGATVVVEAKCFPPVTPSAAEFAGALAPYLSRISLCSFDERVLAEARRRHEPIETTFLIKRPASLTTAARTIGPRRELVTAELVEAAHARRLRVVPWTVNDVREMTALIDLGVDGLVTDEPALAREVAAARLAVAA